MRSLQLGILSILAFLSLLFLLSINPSDEDNGVVHQDLGVWMRKNHLLLPSQWRSVPPPTPNSATNAAHLNEKSFAAATKNNGESKMNQLLLPSMQWKNVNQKNLLPSLQNGRVPPPAPNPVGNVVDPATIKEKSFVGLKSKKKQLLLPSLQNGRVPPPVPNPGGNAVGPAINQKSFVGSKPEKKHDLLLPSLENGLVPPPSPNSVHNSLNPVGEMNFAGLKTRKSHILPPPRTNPGQNSVSGKNFAARKMATGHPPHASLAKYILKGYLLN